MPGSSAYFAWMGCGGGVGFAWEYAGGIWILVLEFPAPEDKEGIGQQSVCGSDHDEEPGWVSIHVLNPREESRRGRYTPNIYRHPSRSIPGKRKRIPNIVKIP
jgi:hypothetical protein